MIFFGSIIWILFGLYSISKITSWLFVSLFLLSGLVSSTVLVINTTRISCSVPKDFITLNSKSVNAMLNQLL